MEQNLLVTEFVDMLEKSNYEISPSDLQSIVSKLHRLN